MDDAEIVVGRRKGVDEPKALKLLAKFLRAEQEKDVDDQLPADVLHQLQQVEASLKGKDVRPLALATTLASQPPPPLEEEEEQEEESAEGFEEHEDVAAATAEAAGAKAPPSSSEKKQKKHKKKRHKKE